MVRLQYVVSYGYNVSWRHSNYGPVNSAVTLCVCISRSIPRHKSSVMLGSRRSAVVLPCKHPSSSFQQILGSVRHPSPRIREMRLQVKQYGPTWRRLDPGMTTSVAPWRWNKPHLGDSDGEFGDRRSYTTSMRDWAWAYAC